MLWRSGASLHILEASARRPGQPQPPAHRRGMSSTAFGDELHLAPPAPVAGIRPRLDSVDLLRDLALYPVCRCYAGLKARRHDAWLRYL
jgi:hypothetical protein